MDLNDFDFTLPHELIAKEPVHPRDKARLMVINKKNGNRKDSFFYNLPDILKKGDVLVLNNSKVIPARLIGKLENGSEIEVFILEVFKKTRCLVKPAKKIKGKAELFFGNNLRGVVSKDEEGFEIIFNESGKELTDAIEKIGTIPLPPYILKEREEKLANEEDKSEYQTVYAKEEGSVASPTAGLHFTKKLLENLKDKGVEILEVTLHVGLGTFEPIREEDYTKHKMHSENYTLDLETAKRLNEARKEKRRIIPVGTTSLRVLESSFKDDTFKSGSGETDIFIYPGYDFKAVDGLITNFHLPKSSLLLLVSAFLGVKETKKAYKEAIKKDYRFYSYGDGMIII